ncbi:MAG: hypothetical protein LBQ03_00970 [Puniceicoccales bacterium]|jgi:hypothetical protein|nr:hypothetical protein [Puniceicoccales bacterium]
MKRLKFLRILCLFFISGMTSVFSAQVLEMNHSPSWGPNPFPSIRPLEIDFSVLEQNRVPDRTLDRALQSDERQFISKYIRSMRNDGYQETFIDAVVTAMHILYSEGIRELLPKEIAISDVVYSEESKIMRRRVTNKLKDIMEKHGGDYGIINQYLKAQQQNSFSLDSLVMKYFLLKQHKRNTPDFLYNLYYLGNNTAQDLELQFVHSMITKLGGGYRTSDWKYFTTVSFYKAYVAIALHNVEVKESTYLNGQKENTKLIDHEKNICRIQRGMRRQDLCKFYPGYANIREGEVFSGPMRHGIADSGALGASASLYTRSDVYDVIEMEIPFSRILAAYFISPELCFDGPPYGIQPNKSLDSRDNKMGRGSEHEIICDMSNIPIKIRKISSQRQANAN